MNKQTNSLMFSSKKIEWYTPLDLYKLLNYEFNFFTDPCAEKTNRLGCQLFYTEEDNGLEMPWVGNVFINPPYGRSTVKRWVKAAHTYVASHEHRLDTVVMLLPARTDTSWFHDYIYKKEGVEIRFLRGRVKFEGSLSELDGQLKTPVTVRENAPFPSMIVIMRGTRALY